ncbi:hypothetical protein L7F22_049395 [Adiantum nelumboides]|nr:hypothetical protein [Adiantum nelumboides]
MTWISVKRNLIQIVRADETERKIRKELVDSDDWKWMDGFKKKQKDEESLRMKAVDLLLSQGTRRCGIFSCRIADVGSFNRAADLLIRNPRWLHSDLEMQRSERRSLKIVELGAGTGLVGLVAAKHLQTIENGTENHQESKDLISLTDYHPTVLDHLRSNVNNVMKNQASPSLELKVEKLDWEEVESGFKSIESTTWIEGRGDSDLILAADVVYSQTHASWLHSTIFCTLKIDLQWSSEREQVQISKSRAHVLCAKREEVDLVNGL